MAELYSQYVSGTQFSTGTITGSATGVSGLNPIVDRLNSISNDNGIYSNLGSGTGIDINTGSVVALRNKTSHYALPGTAFHGLSPDVDNIAYNVAGAGDVELSASITAGTLIAPVNLPHGVVVTGARVQGADVGNTWSLMKSETVMATAAINSGDSSISSATIDNTVSFENAYHFKVTGMDTGDSVTFATINYTTNYD